MSNKYRYYVNDEDKAAGIYTCWCPCGCGCRSDAFIMGNDGLCVCCEKNISHKVAPDHCGPPKDLLMHQHNQIATFLQAYNQSCNTCDRFGTIDVPGDNNWKQIDCPDCKNPHKTCPVCNKDKTLQMFPFLYETCWECTRPNED